MANPHQFYLIHMNKKTGYRATWDPGRPLIIGQIGKLDKSGVFTVYSSLEKEGIPIEILTDTSASEMDYTSHDQVNISIKAKGATPVTGSVLTKADAGFTIGFKSERAVVFQAKGFKTHQITNLKEIEKQVREKYKNGNWEKHWLIITTLVETSAATIIISNSKNVMLDLKAQANVGTAKLKLTDASLGLSVAREQGSTLKFLAEAGLTPLYTLSGIRHPLFGKPTMVKKLAQTESFKKQPFKMEEVK